MKCNFRNRDLFYEVHGQGPAIVLVHGFLESKSIWESLVPELAKKHLVIAMDLPGHGKSDCIEPVHTMELFAEALNSLLSHLQISQAIFIGHSMGGYAALAMAELYESKVAGLILLNSIPNADSTDRIKNRNRALAFLEKHPKEYVRLSIHNLFVDGTQNKYAHTIEKLRAEAMLFPIAGIRGAILGMRDRKDRSDILQQFKKVKLMICGSDDAIIPIQQSKTAATYCKTPIKVIEGGHMLLTENLNEIVKIVHFNDFFDI